ncbi:MAG: hypothetical protein JNG89_05085 [Planctomycetaceae bacterium]|nr:hypothetical protein [Planctomycetaceae bacterium]
MNFRCGILLALAWITSAPATGLAGWPFTSDGPRHGSQEYYEMRSSEPYGQRQAYRYGKMWPPEPRAGGKPQPCIHRFYAQHYWPYPYTAMDQADVNLVSDLQIGNGWLSLCTFYPYHFDPVTNKLNSSGQTHLQWLLSNVPLEQRQAFLAMSNDRSINDRRMSSMQESVATMLGDARSLPITLRVSSEIGRPASEIDSIFKQRLENMDSPVIPFAAATTGGN